MQSQFCSSCLFPHPSVLSQHPPSNARPLHLNHKLAFHPAPCISIPSRAGKPFGCLQTETLPPFPKPAPSFSNIPLILLLFCAHEVKIFFFPLPFSPFLLWCIPAPKACRAASPARCSSIPAAGPVEELELEGGMPAAAPPPAS